MMLRDLPAESPRIGLRRSEVYRERDWPLVRCRVLKPFWWKREELRHGVRTALEPIRVTVAGELIEAFLPDAESFRASGRVEFL